MAQTVKNPPAIQETWVQSLGQEDPLENRMATHSSILAWRIPWTEEPGELESMRSQRVGHDGAANTFTKKTEPKDSFTGHRKRSSLGPLRQWEFEGQNTRNEKTELRRNSKNMPRGLLREIFS